MYLIHQSHDGPVIFEQRHGSCLLIRVKTLTHPRQVKQSKLIEKPATTNNELMTQPGHAAWSTVTVYTLRTNGALKDLIGTFTLSQIQDPIWCFRGPLSRVLCFEGPPMLRCSEEPLRCFRAPHARFFEAPYLTWF